MHCSLTSGDREFLFVTSLVVAIPSMSWAQPVQWKQLFPEHRPAARAYHVMAFDSFQTLLFGGANDLGAPFGDTWLWDGDQWIEGPSGPSPRKDAAVAYDPVRNVVVLFGGETTTGPEREVDAQTWEWNGSAWTLSPAEGPSARYGHAMAFDPVGGGVILFGGNTIDHFRDDTWRWDGTAWAVLSPPGETPSARDRHVMACDHSEQKILMFGGDDSGPGVLGDTWEWDGDSWTRLAADEPPQRRAASMAYDNYREKVVRFGGGDSTVYGETMEWSWEDNKWEDRGLLWPSARQGTAIAFNDKHHVLVLFGGDAAATGASMVHEETWALGCAADFDGSGFIDLEDYSAFVNAFEEGSETADFDESGFDDTDDFDAFVHAFEEGC